MYLMKDYVLIERLEKIGFDYSDQSFLHEAHKLKRKMTDAERYEYEKPFVTKFNQFYGMNKKFELDIDGTKVKVDWSHHSKAQYVERVGTWKLGVLYNWLDKCIRAVYDMPRAEYVIYSQSKKQALIAEWFPTEKRLRMITVLPPHKNEARHGSKLVLAENHSLTVIWID